MEETKKPDNYITTVSYRGHNIDVFDDDYGQQYYFILDGKEIGCGAYNFDYEGCIQYYIDEKLDHIEIIHNTKPYHPSAEVRWMTNQETGERKKVLRYDGFVIELKDQDSDYHEEVRSEMDRIDKEYDEMHKDEPKRKYISDLMREYKSEDESSD